jgi:hypothetical protein
VGAARTPTRAIDVVIAGNESFVAIESISAPGCLTIKSEEPVTAFACARANSGLQTVLDLDQFRWGNPGTCILLVSFLKLFGPAQSGFRVQEFSGVRQMSRPDAIAFPAEVKVKCGSEANEDTRTARLNRLAASGAAVAFILAANVSAAAPLGHGAAAMIEANATLGLVEQVHGTHRSCLRGWVPRWHVVRWHRHVGVSRTAIRC